MSLCQMIVRVWCESGAGWAPTHVPVTPHTTCRDVLDCCREPGDEPCLLLSVHSQHGVHVLRDTELPLEVASALGPDVQFVLKYVDEGEWKNMLLFIIINKIILQKL
ncbi:hypothetical protein O3G_MSEX001631 [Manduca sexta]|uniref:Ras-associating domain-containing protein n=1 Tax=Manduca sexta TaxID=7130 RepID=A0A921YKK6_MANSE|nr:hypothetical protein O3G_MSEX001631 [Manduca sexta]